MFSVWNFDLRRKNGRIIASQKRREQYELRKTADNDPPGAILSIRNI